MKKTKQNFLLLSSLFILLSMTSCKVIEKYTSNIFKKESTENTTDATISNETITTEEDNLNFY